tara:strand:- start:3392 stop:3772 length:381 start_codon:yes stop_codon:yes gene_type:complete
MILLRFENLKNLNTSLQVGDAIYTTSTSDLLNDDSKQGSDISGNQLVGILRKIDNTTNPTNTDLYVNDSDSNHIGTVNTGDFIMFSKYDQSDGDIKGYYMEVQLVNNSPDKAELFSVGSEVTESSK